MRPAAPPSGSGLLGGRLLPADLEGIRGGNRPGEATVGGRRQQSADGGGKGVARASSGGRPVGGGLAIARDAAAASRTLS
nr:unnamed protein product [Digitaria exilis]